MKPDVQGVVSAKDDACGMQHAVQPVRRKHLHCRRRVGWLGRVDDESAETLGAPVKQCTLPPLESR